MKRRLFAGALVAAALVAALLPSVAFAGTYVIDGANVISAEAEARMEDLSAKLEAATPGAQVAVVTVPTLGGKDIESFAEAKFEQLGVGSKENDNGVLLLVTMKEREVRIEVGYGLEGAIPDARAGAVIDSDIVPLLKAGDLSGGIELGHGRLVALVAQEYNAQVGQIASEKPDDVGPFGCWIGLVIFIAILALLVIAVRRGGGGEGGGGGFGGPFIGPSEGGGFGGGGDFGGGGGFGGGDSGGGGASGGW
jgi:uncharacterized protein